MSSNIHRACTLVVASLAVSALGFSASPTPAEANAVDATVTPSPASEPAEPDCEDPEVSCAQFCTVIFAKHQLSVAMCNDLGDCCYSEYGCNMTAFYNYYNEQFHDLAVANQCVGGFNIIPSCWLAEDGFCPPNSPGFSSPEACFAFCIEGTDGSGGSGGTGSTGSTGSTGGAGGMGGTGGTGGTGGMGGTGGTGGMGAMGSTAG